MIVLDTNVVSEMMRPSPDSNVVDWVTGQAALNLYLSTVSEAELRYGVEILPTGARRDRLLNEVEGMLREDFAGRVIPFDSAAAQAYAVIAADHRAAGRPINHADCQNSGDSPQPGSVSSDEGHRRLRGERDRCDQSLGRCMSTTKLMAAVREYFDDLRRIRASGRRNRRAILLPRFDQPSERRRQGAQAPGLLRRRACRAGRGPPGLRPLHKTAGAEGEAPYRPDPRARRRGGQARR